MKLKNFLYLLILLANSTTFAKGTVSSLNERVRELTEKNYDFFAFNKDKIHYLTGRNRFKKVSYYELVEPKNFQKYKNIIDPEGIAQDILYFSKEKYTIILRKNKRFYQLEKNKLTRFTPKKKFFPQKEFKSNKKKVLGVNLRSRYYIKETSTCIACELSISANVVATEQSGETDHQINSEFTLFSQFKFSPTSFIRYGLGIAPYILEDKNLQSIRTYGVKNQIFFRQNLYSTFFEVGGGISKFSIDTGYAVMQTARLGYTPHSNRWYATKSIFIKDFYVSASRINWFSTINEIKFGFSLGY